VADKSEKELSAERKAAALRANLKRRKAASRKAKPSQPQGEEPETGNG